MHEAVSLKLVNEFPSATQDSYITYINNISCDANGNIFITDWRSSTIHIFNMKGKPSGTVHRPGRGPGEFFYPNYSLFHQNLLHIYDTGNRRIVITDLEGKEINSFIFERNVPTSFTIADGNYFMLPYYARIPATASSDLSLIHVYDESGVKLYEFGSLPKMVENMLPIAAQARITAVDDQLFVLFTYYPILRVYSLKGELELEYLFDKQRYEHLIPQNYQSRSFSEQGANIRYLFRGLTVDESGIYILHHNNPLRIDHFDRHLNYIQTFTGSPDFKVDYVLDMCAVHHQTSEKSGKWYFYVANSFDNEYKISVFEVGSGD
jgi:hypothetical protein